VRIPSDLVTPCLLVDRDVLEANIAEMAAFAVASGMALRPHAKTHKCLPIAAAQLDAGAAGLTVATVAEAEVFAEVCSDLFIAYPVWADAARGRRLRELAERVRLRVGVDSAEAADALARHAGPLEVLVEIDSGHRRTGVVPERAGEIALAAARAGLTVRGVFTFPGHAYGPDAARPAAAGEAAALAVAADGLAACGLEAGVRSGGSTPSAACTDASVVTELRPGVYVFSDAQQVTLGACPPERVALVAAATVVSARRDAVVLDAGSKVLGADRPGWAPGFGHVLGRPGLVVSALSEHHATVPWPDGPVPAVGDVLALVPNHVCATVNLADELNVIRGGKLTERWTVSARGANT
jgi:D-serine deaminase-like pyridoxal phosphate-dependent protein